MNIFYLDDNPFTAASFQCDKHVVKMVLETAQMLCTAHHILGKPEENFYKKTHVNHPCSIWVRESIENYMWTFDHFLGLGQEYTRRYKKKHKSIEKLEYALRAIPAGIEKTDWTDPALAMPDEFKTNDPVESYRQYYKSKDIVMKWTGQDVPWWYK